MTKLTPEGAQAMTEFLRRKAAGGLLSPDPHMPDSETVTAFARALPRMTKLLEKAKAGGFDLESAALDILDDRDPHFPPTASASLPPAPSQPAPVQAGGPAPLTSPPSVGDVVHVFIEGVDATVVQADPANDDYIVEYADGTRDPFSLADLGTGSPPSGVTVSPGAGPGGSTVVSGVPTVPATPHNWSIGDRVKSKKDHRHVGTVASLPSGAVVQLGGHTLGNEMGVDLDASAGGGRMVADVDQWEAE